MHVIEQLEAQLQQLELVIRDLPIDLYTQPVPALSNATIGDHTRHVIEILQCAIQGHAAGIVDYHNRERDLSLALDIPKAMSMLAALGNTFRQADKAVMVISSASGKKEDQVLSTYYRELQYNVEHAIHHMALMKVAFLGSGIPAVPENFGVAYSTVAFREQQPGS